ncbi:DUF4271 domain-containing protein [Tenacibaculum finnmarkense genomovar finnmarkense]|uniref:DUF4271 domain-containing protein n=1 Tax=Tenacibaculum finnmarkense TaxID=2781243 RepID=UPI00187B364E|nr:DUF4271 domain-containing protein [Tenacibaculum finnmarkense genomovar finnmarkense]MCG8712943.1 DUF4271 domain-containing protein [Tenacibaculum finnmarkense]MCG8184769.1 DUF4271 domain-containing protein [Tenacibaculum finnmarkense genomovar finnmarkense]MCG8201615.1 DUF4271 domain-containing protein [Tenacibaculum finnmarkense genomovar finnmarkense]MCG8208525.1 DUF4271 domain-containing protein [Tenacibaculum finnmarkense genomovar finnmarkense]
MQAIERIITDNNWITLVILFAIILVAIMKLLAPDKLRDYTFAFFTSGFFKKKVDDNPSVFSVFYILLFFFATITISLFLFLMLLQKYYLPTFFNYTIALCFVVLYYVLKYSLEAILANIIQSNYNTKYFLATKSGYLSNLSLWLFPAIIIYQYAFNSPLFLLIYSLILFIFRAFLIFINNKKIVIRKFFYFILYFCTLEIAPLLIVYKITTT